MNKKISQLIIYADVTLNAVYVIKRIITYNITLFLFLSVILNKSPLADKHDFCNGKKNY